LDYVNEIADHMFNTNLSGLTEVDLGKQVRGKIQILQNRCLQEIKATPKAGILQQLCEDHDSCITPETIQEIIDTKEFTANTYSLEEALQTLANEHQSCLYKLESKNTIIDSTTSSRGINCPLTMERNTQRKEPSCRYVRIRKHGIEMNGTKKLIVVFRDLSDAV